ncbi:MAG: carbon monoxide dehydrogenase [Chloroflexi bacterium]|nr:MAG: carbon monoxide dehydrogenase [Chloroflexota bacterium]
MQFEGSETINAPVANVWAYLTDPNQVSECVPGLKSIEVTEPGKKFQAVAAVGLGAMRATFTTDVEWIELTEPSFASMKAHGTAPGSAADVVAEMQVVDNGDDSSTLNWSAEVEVVGTIASLAARMMNTAAKQLTGQFFRCVKSKIEV